MFLFNDLATTEIYTLSLHDALPICAQAHFGGLPVGLILDPLKLYSIQIDLCHVTGLESLPAYVNDVIVVVEFLARQIENRLRPQHIDKCDTKIEEQIPLQV